MGKIYGYIRVSSTDQNETRQMKALMDAGVERKNIFTDRQSGKDFDRPKYKKLICNDLLSRVNCRKSPQTFI